MAKNFTELREESKKWDREHPWLRRWYRFTGWAWRHEGWLNPREWYRTIKWFIQRGRRGWSDRDVWSFDWYLARVIAEGIDHLIVTKHGYSPTCPVDATHIMGGGEKQDYSCDYCPTCQMQYSEEATVEAFDAELRDIAKAFRDYLVVVEAGTGLPGEEWDALLKRMHKFIVHFSSLWD